MHAVPKLITQCQIQVNDTYFLHQLLMKVRNCNRYLILKGQLCQLSLWMVGVDRGNPPAKGGTICCQSAKHRRRPLPWQATTRRHYGSLYHISRRSLTTHRIHAGWAWGLPHIYDCWCLRRIYDMTGSSLDLDTEGRDCSRAVRHALINNWHIYHSQPELCSLYIACDSAVGRSCGSTMLLYGLAVPAATAAYRDYPVTVLSRHISQLV